MRSYCCIPNCNSSSVDKEPGISFHEFPTKSHIRNRWLKAIITRVASDFQLDEKTKNKVCSKHFKETDFSPMCWKRKRLKGCAVPSLFYGSKPFEKILEFEIVIKKDVDESHSSFQNKEFLGQSFSTCGNHVIKEDESISIESPRTPQVPVHIIQELNDIDNLSDSIQLELSSEPIHKTTELKVTTKHSSICDEETKKEHSTSDVFVNNTIDGMKRISAQESNVCEFTVFGLYVASQLQQMPLEEAHKSKEKIQNILIQSCPQFLKEPSFFSYVPQSSSDGKSENPFCGLQTKLLSSKNNEKVKNSSFQDVLSRPVILQSIVLPSTTISNNRSYKIYRLEGSNPSSCVYF